MTVISLALNVTQMNRLRSTDTVSEICLNLCVNIIRHLSNVVLSGNPTMSNRVDTINTMLQWYLGFLARACPEDIRYKGIPRITMIYVEKHEIGKEFSSKYAFDLGTPEKVPPRMLVELVNRTVLSTIRCISPSIIKMTNRQVEKWTQCILELLGDLEEALDLNPRVAESALSSAMIRFHLIDGQSDIQDYV